MASVIVKIKGQEVEVRIKNGLIHKLYIKDSSGKDTIYREETHRIRYNLGWILRDDCEKFKEILHLIEKDVEFFAIGMKLMEDERKKWSEDLEKYQKEVDKYLEEANKRKAEYQEKINKYTWQK